MNDQVINARFLPTNFQFLAIRHTSRIRALIGCVALVFVLVTGVAPHSLFASAADDGDGYHLTKIDNDLLDDISRRSFRYFWEHTDPRTGLVLDRVRTDNRLEDAPEHKDVASIAATGFGLTAFCIAAEHRWVSPARARQRILITLRFFAYQAPQEHGWFYHFLDARTGERQWDSEVSSIDTALLLAGVLTARQSFPDDPQINKLATLIYNRVDFPWMLDGKRLILSHGWKPETGFLPYRWDTYSEAMILYALAIGSPTHPISPAAWFAWKLPVVGTNGYTYIGGGPLFIQQYSQAWLNLQDRVYAQASPANGFVPHVDFFTNSVMATRAQQLLGIHLSQQYPGYSENVWGITASDSANGYVAWGGALHDSRIDGTVVPSAAAGSLMFAPDICVPALRAMVLQYGSRIYGRYGFADAFNPNTGWVSRYVIGIDVGITLLSAENLRTGSTWQWFMSSPEIERALAYVGLLPKPPAAGQQGIFVKPEKGSRIANVKSPKQDAEAATAPEIELSGDPKIPVSGFKFVIPISDRQVEYARSRKPSDLPPPDAPSAVKANSKGK